MSYDIEARIEMMTEKTPSTRQTIICLQYMEYEESESEMSHAWKNTKNMQISHRFTLYDDATRHMQFNNGTV